MTETRVPVVQRIDQMGNPVEAYKYATPENETISGSAATTAALTAGLYLITVNTDCYIVIGQAPTATSAGLLLPAGTALPWILDEDDKVSVIQHTGGGTMSVMKLG